MNLSFAGTQREGIPRSAMKYYPSGLTPGFCLESPSLSFNPNTPFGDVSLLSIHTEDSGFNNDESVILPRQRDFSGYSLSMTGKPLTR